MAGETQQMHIIKELDAESKLHDEGTALEQQSDKTTKEFSEHFSSTGTEARASSRGLKVEKLEKERDSTQQREAVIRPQQAGKIDFRSLQNRSKFASDRTWSSGKASPQSPSGKGRSREKGKRSGKSERGSPQQLYRLSITHPRSNPTIGIAYPQQKVSQPKKLETSRGPVSGSYRFHVPSLPEREAELQQEELNYSRCFQEASNLTSPSYTSQTLSSASGASSHQHPPLSQQQQQQQPASMENSAQSGNQLILADFQMSGSNAWQSPERTFTGANYGVSTQKPTALPETNKTNTFVSGPFQYGYHFLEESASDSFPCEQTPPPQDFTDSSLGAVHVAHNSFSFTPGEGQNITQNSTQFSNEQSDNRSSFTHPPQSQFIQGVVSSIQCPRNLSEDSASSDSSGSSSQQSEQGKVALPESTDAIGQADSRDAAITSGSKRNCHPKDTAANQRTLIPGSVHHARNISQGPGSQMHFSTKTFNNPPVSNIHRNSVSFDKNINHKILNRLPHSWEGANKTYSPNDQNTVPFTDMNDKFQFQNQPALDQRSTSSKNSRMSWQHIRPTSAMQNQNRIELSRQISNQKLAYMVSPSDWQDDSKSHKHSSLKNPNSFQNNRTSDGFSNQRQDSVKHGNNTVTTFKVEMSHAQVCESKNKTVYFGLNQSLPAPSSRNFNYPPLQVPPLGLMMVSPYESPLPSPVHNPASSSTCSSLSPASTSPVNLSSEDSQMSKPAPPHPFYHQPQPKTQLPSDHLTTHPHQFHSERSISYTTDRNKDDMMSYMQNNPHPKSTMDGNKGYMDSFGVEHHQPPPPYSAHQLLATSLATANLDQLDVLLTCKQCDQNFNNLASFLGHKQYCAQHTFAQSDLKEIPKLDDSRKFNTEPAKTTSSVSNVSMSRCPSDLHLSLLGLNKNGELIPESETKGDNKDDPMKLSLFSGSGNLPVPLPELEMEDAKLDSLITEALNGLGYQSDNAEIDSSFIDAFVDDELTTVKATSNKQSLKTKECAIFDSKNKQTTEDDRSFTQGKYFYDSDVESPETDKQYTECKVEKISLNLEQDEKINIKKEVSHKNSRSALREKTQEQDSKVKEARKLCKSEDENTSKQRFLLSSKFSERCGVKSFQDNSALRGSLPSQTSTSPTSRTAVKESKRKSSGGGTWSKELIHKIVQQKNKLHKLHVKGTKNLQFSLVMERLTPTVQNPAFGEYDYVSDSDDECEPVKIASQGRLNQSSRCKYTYTKECKWRARSERDQAAWRHESKECFEVKKSEELTLLPEKHSSHQKLRRRGSRSSTSSELSTSVSVSSDSINSPKSTDRTDSDCEKKTDIKKKEPPELKPYERSSPQKLCKESSKLALTFTKSVKKYNTDKAVVSEKKDSLENPKTCHSDPEVADSVSSSQKTIEMVKSLEKSKISHIKSKEKLMSHKETGTTVILDRNTLQTTENLCHKVEPTQCSITDNKPPQTDSHFPTIHKKTDFNAERNTRCKKREEAEGTHSELSGSPTFGKQSDTVCMVKEAITLVNDLDTHKPASLCTSLMDDVCLSPPETQGPLIQKDTLHLIPYTLDQEQGLMKSPLSFDTSSMFGDLATFDSGLYSDMPIQKDTFHSMENASDKKEEFVSSFSPFLEQRDWNLMVSPVLPDELSQFKSNSEKSNEKKPDYNHVSLSLPEKIIDYSANLNCASEDELEIKRIVNELENQLQTTKLESPPLLVQDSPKQLQMSKFSPLRLSDEAENGTGLHIQDINVAVTNMPSEPFTESALPWSSPFQFELISGHHSSPHSPLRNESGALLPLTAKENDESNLIATDSHTEQSEEKKAEKEAPAETKEEILEQKIYTENLMKSLEVISDSIFKKEPIISEHKEPNVTSLTSQQHQEIECQATDAFEREDHTEKEAITGKENILSPPNINERKDDIEFILNESQSSFSDSSDPTVSGNMPISLQPSEPAENNGRNAESKVVLEEDFSENSNFIKSAEMTHDPHVVKGSCRNNNRKENVHSPINNCDSQEHLNTEHEDTEAGKGITGQSEYHPTISDLSDAAVKNGEKIRDITTTSLKATNSYCSEHISSSHADDLKVECSNPDLFGLSPKMCSPSKTYTPNPTTDMDIEMASTYKPCSPILVETDAENISHCSPFNDTQTTEGKNNLLILSQTESIMDSDSCKVSPFNDSLQPEAGLHFDTIQKQEEILNVQDIKEQLPVDFMASQHNSPCREEMEETPCLFIDIAPPTTPLLSSAHQTPMQKAETEQDSCQSQSKCGNMPVDQSLGESTKSPHKENDIQKEALKRDEQLKTTADMGYSLISPPHPDLGDIIDCKIPVSKTNIPSPLPVTSTVEGSKFSERLEKSDPIYDLKLSPLNYNSISDEPPQLNQYDYIPISPPSKMDENTDIKQCPGDNRLQSCDLSISTTLNFNNNEIAIDSTVSLNTDSIAKLNIPKEPLAIQENVQFTHFSMVLPTENTSTDSSAVNMKKDLEVCHDPAEPIEHVHIHTDVLRKVGTEKSDSHEFSGEDSALLRKNISDGPPTPKPLIICETEQMHVTQDPSEKHLTIETGQCSTTHQVQKEITPKKACAQNSQQGKVLCEICFMCFRTVPGLKRHKAMKHSVRAEKHIGLQNTTSNHQGTMFIYEASQTSEKEHKDDSQTCFSKKIDGIPETSNILISKSTESETVGEEMPTETSAVAVDEIDHEPPLQPTKAKKNNKARKSKNSEVNIKPDPFSDELLNILKTDILQAITPEFKSNGLQGQSKSPEDSLKTITHPERTVTGTKDFPHCVSLSIGFDNTSQSPVKGTNILNETMELHQITDTTELKCTSTTEMAGGEVYTEKCVESVDKDIVKECDESRKSLCDVDEMREEKGSDDSLAQEILRNIAVGIKCENNSGPSNEPLSCLSSSPLSPPGISPDLKALLDDDTTFSQLFPRDEEAKRKKCPRVYSKRNKRQKISMDSNGSHDYPPPENFMPNKDQYVEKQTAPPFADNQSNHCEYETISIDDAIMLNMCHNSTLKNDSKPPLTDVKPKDQEDAHDTVKELGNNLLNQLESTIDKSSIEWNGSSDFNSFSSDSVVTSDPSACKTELPNAPYPVTLPATPYTVEPCVTDSVQNLHSIDIQNINTTFQLPEIQFFDSNKDISVAPPIAAADTENRDDDKSKKLTERRGRKRQDGGIKVKDKQYKCKVCFTWFLTLGELNFHKLSHNPSPPPTCYMCVQRKFSSREQLRDHLREKHAKNKTGIWTCGMCLKEISDVWMYNEHLREHATQFARRGQTQGSMLGISGCFMQETAVKNFITSIMQHRPSKANRESSKAPKDQEKAVPADRTVGDGKTAEGAESKLRKTKSSSGTGGKQSTLTPLEVLHKTETPRSVEMHPNCKDPSRDCHHCGKQFPKPFKLQRHLVVHNLEKIFLCHKCPVTYQEAQELKDHLKRAHEEVDELDSKHTTLYTCELCADVMHVIKKSFICSTCNYTFSKKEQFDRHMEKHLSGGNKIFKFRGVLRPVKASVSKEDECDSPASKKRRILSDSLLENSSDSGIASVSPLHLNQNSETLSSKSCMSTTDDSTQTISNEYHDDTNSTNVKTEDIAEDYSELLVELEKCIHMRTSDSSAPKEEIDPALLPNLDKEGNGKSIAEPCDVKEENEPVCIREETSSWSASKESGNIVEETIKAQEDSVEGDTADTEEKTGPLPPCEDSCVASLRENLLISKTPESAKHQLAIDVADQQGNDEQSHDKLKASNNHNKQPALSHGAEQQGSSQMKDKGILAKSTDNTRNNYTTTTDTPSKVSLSTSASNEEKEPVRPQKKRKDMRSPHSLQRVSSPATQENLAVDARAKKKFRPSKCTNSSLQRKSDGPNDYPVLSSVQDDLVSNKIVSKCKNSNLSLQSKRSLLDSCTPKKAEIVSPLNGDYKAKKGTLGRPLHSPMSKVSSVPMNNSLNKSRTKMGVRSMDSHSYRTAESQNHLLSQLFGQKLTSFKIPLRKDTSESIN